MAFGVSGDLIDAAMRFPFLSVDPKKQFNEYDYSPTHLSRLEEQPTQNVPRGSVRSQGRA